METIGDQDQEARESIPSSGAKLRRIEPGGTDLWAANSIAPAFEAATGDEDRRIRGQAVMEV